MSEMMTVGDLHLIHLVRVDGDLVDCRSEEEGAFEALNLSGM